METLSLKIAGQADAVLHGTVLHKIEFIKKPTADGDDNWTRLTLLETCDGDWLIAGEKFALGVTGMVGDYKRIKKPKVMARPDGVYGLDGDAKDATEAERLMINRVMEWLGWSFLAKELAERMGWSITIDVM